MRNLLVRDVMVANPVTAYTWASFKEVADLLERHRVGALPVLDDAGRVVGVVSEDDLLPKQAYLGQRRRPSLRRRRRRRLRAKVEARTASGLMTSPAIVVDGSATIAAASRLMVRNDVKQLPVVEPDGTLIGMVSRANLITAFLRSDREIRADILDQAVGPNVLAPPEDVTVRVHDGVVHLKGQLENRSDIARIEDLVSHIDGVVRVVNELDYRHNDVVSPSELYPRGEAPYYGTRFP